MKIPEIEENISSLKSKSSLTGIKLSYCKDVASLLKIGFIDELDAQIFLEEHLLSWKDKGVPVSMVEVSPTPEVKLTAPAATTTPTSSSSSTVCELSWSDIDLEADKVGKAIVIGNKQ